eukprot:TRINITY_DN7706_c0_g1_i1.p1 TRINITY_DN7706_c0_g1~~TRINITY_DN7706_c0_g1_i1.p1  ORF type:complete len:211 (-),score=36.43 TRINITY_DN7706_c0_g1_i1:57-689(-)
MFVLLVYIAFVALIVHYFTTRLKMKKRIVVEVREVLLNDDDVEETLLGISDLLKHTFGESVTTITSAHFLAMLWANKGALYVATTRDDNGEEIIVGTLQFEAKWEHFSGPLKGEKKSKPSAFFSNMVVVETYRGNGFCRQMLQQVVDEGWERLNTFDQTMCATVTKENPILPFYQKLGLRIVEETSDVYFIEGNLNDIARSHFKTDFSKK